MKKLILPLVLGTMIFTSCEQKAEKAAAFDIEAAKKEITAWNDQFAAVISNKDSVGFANLYAPDAVRMGPNAPQIEGKANIINNFNGAMKAGIGSGKLTMVEAFGDENAVTEVGTYVLNATDGTQMDKGKYIAIFKKVDGKLTPVRDIWNSDLPVMPLAK
jgi:ketosteroid isomerase-like protein